MVVLRSLILAAALAAAGAAQAHVTLPPEDVAAGSYKPLRFQVGHGCGDKATTALRIEMPAGVSAARPQPKPGWTLDIARSGDTVTAITWRGSLPGDQFDEFLVLVHLPDSEGLLYFPAAQTCGGETVRWDEPQAKDDPAPKRPAPRITVMPRAGPSPAAAPAEHHHQD